MSEDPLAKALDNPVEISNIYLIGYRGSGKTTIARLLAAKLCWECVDADAELEQRQGRTIAQIFNEDGEAGFHDHEAALLAEMCRPHPQVLTTAVCPPR